MHRVAGDETRDVIRTIVILGGVRDAFFAQGAGSRHAGLRARMVVNQRRLVPADHLNLQGL